MTAIHAVTVPKWGLSMEDGLITHWHVAEGTPVTTGQELVDIETSKIANVVEAPTAGILRKIVAAQGERVLVGQLLAVIADTSIPDAELQEFVERHQANFVPPEPAVQEEAGPRHVDVAGRRISYMVTGPADSDRIPVILLHGFGSDANSWLFNISELAANRRVFAPDLPGHGASCKEVGNGSVELLAEAVLGFMAVVGIRKAHFVAHSMGALVALDIAARKPECVASLALISPAGFGKDINAAFINGLVTAQTRRELKPVLALLVNDEKLVTREMLDDVLRFKRLDGAATALQAIAAAVFPNGEQVMNVTPLLAGFPMPVTVIWGREDRILDPSQAQTLKPSAGLHMISAAGHLPHMEAVSKVNRILLDILGNE